MILHVVEARYEHDFVVYLRFNDGAEGYVDLSGELYGEMFAPLRDKGVFAAFKLDPELGTLVWPNGADLAPEFLRDRLRVPAEPLRPKETAQAV